MDYEIHNSCKRSEHLLASLADNCIRNTIKQWQCNLNMPCALVNRNVFMWIISFNPNDCVKESKICIRILHIGEVRLKECKWVTQGLAVYYVVKPTQMQVVYLPGYGSFQSGTAKCLLLHDIDYFLEYANNVRPISMIKPNKSESAFDSSATLNI